MDRHYGSHLRPLDGSARFRRAVVFSVALHVAFAMSLAFPVSFLSRRTPPQSIAISFGLPKGGPPNLPAGDPAPGDPGPPRMAPPEPDPPKPPPEPEPPKPEPPKPEPKPEPKVEPKPEPKPKPDPVKETKPKPDSEKPKPKTETAKTTDSSAKKTGKENTKLTKAEIKEMMSPLGDLPIGPKSSGVPGATGFEVGVRADEGFPSELSGWARLVRRKILLTWEKPAGIKLTADNNKAEVAFWVDRQGNLLGDPQIVSEKSDPELSASGVKAIVSAAPLPPLPDEFKAMEQEVIFEFMLIQQ